MDEFVKIRRASLSDAESLGVIGPAAYSAIYHYLWDDCVALAHQLNTFSTQSFLTLLQKADTKVWVAEAQGVIIGFLIMIMHSKNPITYENAGAEISRIYLLPGSQKMGIGFQLMSMAREYANKLNLTHMWLDVMSSAKHARKAYSKWGFIEIGTKVFPRSVKFEYSQMAVLRMSLV